MGLTHLQMVLYAIFKNAGIENKECAAFLTLLDEKDQDDVIVQIAHLMDSNDWQLPTEQELMEILFPILKGKRS